MLNQEGGKEKKLVIITHTYIYTYIHVYIILYICLYRNINIHTYMCICIYLYNDIHRERERGREYLIDTVLISKTSEFGFLFNISFL